MDRDTCVEENHVLESSLTEVLESSLTENNLTENSRAADSRRQFSVKRNGEDNINSKFPGSRLPSRGSRFFKLANNWYFTTREGFSMGPYDSYELAGKGTEDYLAFVSTAAPHILKLFAPDSQTVPA